MLICASVLFSSVQRSCSQNHSCGFLLLFDHWQMVTLLVLKQLDTQFLSNPVKVCFFE